MALLFCDTSALIKFYIHEPGSDEVTVAAEQAEAVAVCRVAWAEFHAALARRGRELEADSERLEAAKAQLKEDWPRLLVLDVTQEVVEKAGEFADGFALRGFDAIHLAAAWNAREESGLPVTFAAFDRRLVQAARLLGLAVVPRDP